MFGQDAGFYTLAGIMLILGVSTLGNLNTKAMTQETIGMAFWRIIISAGVLAMVVSVLNVLAVSKSKPPICILLTLYLLILPELPLQRPQSRRQRPPRPSLWRSRTTESNEPNKQPPHPPPEHEARRNAPVVHSIEPREACHPALDWSLPSEDLQADKPNAGR